MACARCVRCLRCRCKDGQHGQPCLFSETIVRAVLGGAVLLTNGRTAELPPGFLPWRGQPVVTDCEGRLLGRTPATPKPPRPRPDGVPFVPTGLGLSPQYPRPVDDGSANGDVFEPTFPPMRGVILPGISNYPGLHDCVTDNGDFPFRPGTSLTQSWTNAGNQAIRIMDHVARKAYERGIIAYPDTGKVNADFQALADEQGFRAVHLHDIGIPTSDWLISVDYHPWEGWEIIWYISDNVLDYATGVETLGTVTQQDSGFTYPNGYVIITLKPVNGRTAGLQYDGSKFYQHKFVTDAYLKKTQFGHFDQDNNPIIDAMGYVIVADDQYSEGYDPDHMVVKSTDPIPVFGTHYGSRYTSQPYDPDVYNNWPDTIPFGDKMGVPVFGPNVTTDPPAYFQPGQPWNIDNVYQANFDVTRPDFVQYIERNFEYDQDAPDFPHLPLDYFRHPLLTITADKESRRWVPVESTFAFGSQTITHPDWEDWALLPGPVLFGGAQGGDTLSFYAGGASWDVLLTSLTLYPALTGIDLSNYALDAVSQPHSYHTQPLDQAGITLVAKGNDSATQPKYFLVLASWNPWRDASDKAWTKVRLTRPKTEAEYMHLLTLGKPLPAPPSLDPSSPDSAGPPVMLADFLVIP